MPVNLSGKRKDAKPAPLLGEANRYILTGLLGITEKEMVELEKEEIIGSAPIGFPKTKGLNINAALKQNLCKLEPEYIDQLRQFFADED